VRAASESTAAYCAEPAGSLCRSRYEPVVLGVIDEVCLAMCAT
jgi:hypothetical protein